MIRFPVFRSLRIDDYQLFPGSADSPGLNIVFEKGPTLIAGVNGLGKSTLIAIMLRTLAGPFDIPREAQHGDLGEVEPKPVSINARQIFTPRVADGAQFAKAKLELSFGARVLTIERNLSDLTLSSCTMTLPDMTVEEESTYQGQLAELMGVGSFFDALLILRYVVFLLEDRRALVWGRTAQREILRALFVEPNMAAELSRLRYEMLSADSAFRNMRSVLNRRIKENKGEIRRITGVSGVRAELAVHEAELTSVREEEDRLERSVALDEVARHEARLRAAKAALNRDSALRELERAKIHLLQTTYKGIEDSGLYVLARLLSDEECLVCDTRKPGIGKEVSDRLAAGSCPVCGTPKKANTDKNTPDLSTKRIKELQNQIQLSEDEIRSSDLEMKRADETRRNALNLLMSMTKRRLDLGETIRSLRTKLPKSEQPADALDQRNHELDKLIKEEEFKYKEGRQVFEDALRKSEKEVAKEHQKVAKAFAGYAGEFLKERCRIAFQPVRVRIGQTGSDFEVGLFQLSMSGSAVGGETPRSEPDQVSLSQREFLDLAFRMALMTVAAGSGSATLVVDTPESSLDFLFAERAGNQLARFAREGGKLGNRVIATTNLANAHIIPAFLRGRPKGQSARSRVVDLMDVAAQNAAVREDHDAYSKFLAERINEAQAQNGKRRR